MNIHVHRPNACICRQSKGNHFSKPDDILTKLHMPYHSMVIYTQYTFHEILLRTIALVYVIYG